MTIFNAGMVRRESRRQAESEFFHKKILQEIRYEMQDFS